MHVYKFAEAKQNLTSIFEQAILDGGVQIDTEDGQAFILTPIKTKSSPLDVTSVPLNLTADEIIAFIHDSRK